MLKKRVIPIMLWADHGLVKGRNFDHSRRVGSAVSAINVYASRDVDELLLLDVRATQLGEHPKFSELELLARECSFPLGIGGGVKTLDDVAGLLRIGADKVVINSAAYFNKALVEKASKEFGSQSIVVSVDFRILNGTAMCFSHCGRNAQSVNVLDWVREVEQLGAGEIVVCNCDRDGEMIGFDLETIAEITQAVSIPVIASGGAGMTQHFVDAITIAGADAVAAGSVFHFTEITPHSIKEALSENGIPVRGRV